MDEKIAYKVRNLEHFRRTRMHLHLQGYTGCSTLPYSPRITYFMAYNPELEICYSTRSKESVEEDSRITCIQDLSYLNPRAICKVRIP